MILFPAIDLRGGKCVRLRQGDRAQATVFNDDPADQAKKFAQAGAEWLHLVDLDGALAGRPVNEAAIATILEATPLRCQLGGGIRDLVGIEAWLEKGVKRVILGTVALKDPDLVRQAAAKYPGRIAVAIDAQGGKVATEGWAERGEMPALDLARRFEDAGVAAIIFTDIDRDGLLKGVNLRATAELANQISVPVIASGGVAGMADLDHLAALAPATRAMGGGIAGVIAGRALYDGGLDLEAALARLRQVAPC